MLVDVDPVRSERNVDSPTSSITDRKALEFLDGGSFRPCHPLEVHILNITIF
jgi:hypothetical protein